MVKEKLGSFKDLIAWQKAYKLTLEIYKITKNFPREEQYGLSAQMRRAAVSVVSNIAEGYGRKGRAEYINFLSMAYASLSELETQLLLSKDLEYIKEENLKEPLILKDEVGGMLFSMQQKLKSAP
ncbi:MAG: four helix bundle protein [Candidatus Omnitrophota bacterium]